MRIICGKGHQMYAEGKTKIASKGSYGYLVASYEIWTCLQCNISVYKQQEADLFISNEKVREMIDHKKDEIIEV
jgi:hypothetical protein